MSDNNKREVKGKKEIFRVTEYSRRQVLKSAGFLTAGAALASISLASACKSSNTTSSGTTTPAGTAENTTDTTTSEPPVSSTTGSTTPTSNSTTPVSSAPATTGYNYVPPTALPQVIPVPNTTCTVATDRAYSSDHIWVKTLPNSMAVMGITPSMVEMLGEPYNVSLMPTGTSLSKEDTFGTVEGYKITADLITPVSGTVIQINVDLIAQSDVFGYLTTLITYPFNAGYLVVVLLSDPNELKSLLTAQAYVNLLEAGG